MTDTLMPLAALPATFVAPDQDVLADGEVPSAGEGGMGGHAELPGDRGRGGALGGQPDLGQAELALEPGDLVEVAGAADDEFPAGLAAGLEFPDRVRLDPLLAGHGGGSELEAGVERDPGRDEVPAGADGGVGLDLHPPPGQ